MSRQRHHHRHSADPEDDPSRHSVHEDDDDDDDRHSTISLPHGTVRITHDEQVSNEATAIFHQLDEQIEALERKSKGLETLLTRMSKCQNAFDAEDIGLVQRRLEDCVQAYNHLLKQRRQRAELYDKTVKRMEEALQIRMAILQETDSETQCLEDNSDLMEALSRKQAKLESLLLSAKRQLVGPLDEK